MHVGDNMYKNTMISIYVRATLLELWDFYALPRDMYRILYFLY